MNTNIYEYNSIFKYSHVKSSYLPKIQTLFVVSSAIAFTIWFHN